VATNRRISEFPEIAGTTIDETDLLTLVHVFEVDPVLRNKKITFSGFKDYLNQYYVPKTGGIYDGNIVISGVLTVSGASSFTSVSATTATFTSGAFTSGTAAAPSVSVGTTDNGLYSPGTDQLALATSGTGRLFIDANGNIGIGSASTLAKFQVAGLSNYGMPAVEIEGVDAFYDITDNGSVSGLDATDAFYGGIPLNTAIRNDTNTAGINFTNYGIQNHVLALDTGAGEFSIFSRDPSSRYSKVHITGSPERGLLFGIRGTDKFQFAHYSTSVDRAYESLFEISPTAVTSTFSGTERFRINSDGRLLIGASSASQIGSTNSAIQVRGTDSDTGGISISRFSNNNASGYLSIGKARGIIATPVIVNDDDTIGTIQFAAYDGNDLATSAAQITAEVDGTPGADDIPGRLVFSVTADGSASPTEAMRIKNSRIINIANTPTYADNAAAKTGGLVDGDVYRTSTGDLKIVYT
jgi:hypothetical protein